MEIVLMSKTHISTKSQYILFSGYTGFLYKLDSFLLVLIRNEYIMKSIDCGGYIFRYA